MMRTNHRWRQWAVVFMFYVIAGLFALQWSACDDGEPALGWEASLKVITKNPQNNLYDCPGEMGQYPPLHVQISILLEGGATFRKREFNNWDGISRFTIDPPSNARFTIVVRVWGQCDASCCWGRYGRDMQPFWGGSETFPAMTPDELREASLWTLAEFFECHNCII